MRYLLPIFLFLATTTMAETTHTVKQNESLWKIAKKHYGSGLKWRRVYDANRDRIRNQNRIRPGQVLRIPDQGIKSFNTPPAGYEYWKTVKVKLSAYCPCWRCCGRFADGRTSIGRNAWNADGCGVDPRIIPYYTMIRIPGAGLRMADDTGPAMRRSRIRGITHIDVRMGSHWMARQWGVRWKSVEMYRRI